MSSTGTMNTLAMQCMRDSEEWFPAHAHDLLFLAVCYGGEVGEFQNIVKKIARGSLSASEPSVRVHLAEELTDGFIYMLNIAALLGIDLERTYERVRATNAKRFGEMAS